MAGLFGHIAAGMAEGVGTNIVEQAKAKREAALRRLEIEGEMAFRRGEREATQAFTSQQNDLDRKMKLADAATIKPTDDMREYAAAKEQGYEGTLQDWITAGRKAGATNVTVGAERGYDKTLGEGYGKRFLEIQTESQTAQRALTQLDVMEQAMADPGFYSGAGANQVQALKRVGAALGLDPDGISSMETFNAMAKGAALDTMGGSLGTGFSNADRDFVLDQVPALTNTPEGNRLLISVQRKLNQRKQEVAKLAREYAGQNDGRIDAGFDDYVSRWAEQNPLFSTTDKPSAEPGQTGGRNRTSSGIEWSID